METNDTQTPQQQVNINIDPSVKPIWADEVMITRMTKQNKDAKGKIEKEGYISLIFVDGFTKMALARLTISKTTAKALANLLNTNVTDLEKDLANKSEIKPAATTIQASTTKSNYIG